MEALLGTDLDLTLTSTADWVATPARMVLLSAQERGGHSFVVRVDAEHLPPGAHFARVQACAPLDGTSLSMEYKGNQGEMKMCSPPGCHAGSSTVM